MFLGTSSFKATLIELVVGPTSVIHRVHGRAASRRMSQFRGKTPRATRSLFKKHQPRENERAAYSSLLSILRSDTSGVKIKRQSCFTHAQQRASKRRIVTRRKSLPLSMEAKNLLGESLDATSSWRRETARNGPFNEPKSTSLAFG